MTPRSALLAAETAAADPDPNPHPKRETAETAERRHVAGRRRVIATRWVISARLIRWRIIRATTGGRIVLPARRWSLRCWRWRWRRRRAAGPVGARDQLRDFPLAQRPRRLRVATSVQPRGHAGRNEDKAT